MPFCNLFMERPLYYYYRWSRLGLNTSSDASRCRSSLLKLKGENDVCTRNLKKRYSVLVGISLFMFISCPDCVVIVDINLMMVMWRCSTHYFLLSVLCRVVLCCLHVHSCLFAKLIWCREQICSSLLFDPNMSDLIYLLCLVVCETCWCYVCVICQVMLWL